MKTYNYFITCFATLLLLAVTCISEPIFAEPAQGLALLAGSPNHSLTDNQTGTNYYNPEYMAGFDYQWPINKKFSIALELSESGGPGKTGTGYDINYIKISRAGLNLRYWLGGLYLGIHQSLYIPIWIDSNSDYTMPPSKAGSGFQLGFEAKNGWILFYQSDNAPNLVLDSIGRVKYSGSTIGVGYRWR